MDIQTAKQIKIADYLHSLGYSPVKQQGINLWYKSPFREETEASFKVNTEREQWYDFGLGKGVGINSESVHPVDDSGTISNCWKLGSEEFCFPKEKDTGRTCGVCSAIRFKM